MVQHLFKRQICNIVKNNFGKKSTTSGLGIGHSINPSFEYNFDYFKTYVSRRDTSFGLKS